MLFLAWYCSTASKCWTRRSSSSTLLANSSISVQIITQQYNQKGESPHQQKNKIGIELESLLKALNELQALTLSGALAVFAITWLFFGLGDDDDDGGGMTSPISQNAD